MYWFLDSNENPPITSYKINYLIQFTLMKPKINQLGKN